MQPGRLESRTWVMLEKHSATILLPFLPELVTIPGMAALKITNPKISLALVEELQDEPLYKTGKAFSATYNFLGNVLYFCRDQEFATIPAKLIKQTFDTYGINYKPCLEVLQRHGINFHMARSAPSSTPSTHEYRLLQIWPSH